MKTFKDILQETAFDLSASDKPNYDVHELVIDHFLKTDEGKQLHGEIKEILKKDLE